MDCRSTCLPFIDNVYALSWSVFPLGLLPYAMNHHTIVSTTLYGAWQHYQQMFRQYNTQFIDANGNLQVFQPKPTYHPQSLPRIYIFHGSPSNKLENVFSFRIS